MSHFWTLRVNSEPRGLEFVNLGVEFGPGAEIRPLVFDCRHTKIYFGPIRVDFRPLTVHFLTSGLWESILGR